MSQITCGSLERIDQARLDQHAEAIGEEALAEAIGIARGTLARARHGLRLYSCARRKICDYLHNAPVSLTG